MLNAYVHLARAIEVLEAWMVKFLCLHWGWCPELVHHKVHCEDMDKVPGEILFIGWECYST